MNAFRQRIKDHVFLSWFGERYSPSRENALHVETVIEHKEQEFYIDAAAIEHCRNFFVTTLARIALSFVPLIEMLQRNKIEFKECASFGSGSSTHELLLALHYKKSSFWCFDQSDHYIPEYNRELFNRLDNCRFSLYDFSSSLDKSFDLVFSIQTLEHIEDWERALDIMCDAVRPGGFIYIDTPLFHEIDGIETDIAQRKSDAWEKHRHYHLGFSRSRMEQRLKDRGFTIRDSGFSCYRKFDQAFFLKFRDEPRNIKRKATVDDALYLTGGLLQSLCDAEQAFRDIRDDVDSRELGKRDCMAIRVLAQKQYP